jgi:cell division initiation protein
MKFTPFGIKNQEFNKTVRGYDKDEVKAFLEKLSDEFERLQHENDLLKSDISRVEDQLKEYKRIEKNLQNALLNATESSNKAVDSAKKQTALIVKEAELKAAQILDKARENANSIRDSVLKLREEKKLLVSRLKAMIGAQANLLDMNIHNADITSSKKKENKVEAPVNENEEIDVNDILEKLL